MRQVPGIRHRPAARTDPPGSAALPQGLAKLTFGCVEGYFRSDEASPIESADDQAPPPGDAGTGRQGPPRGQAGQAVAPAGAEPAGEGASTDQAAGPVAARARRVAGARAAAPRGHPGGGPT